MFIILKVSVVLCVVVLPCITCLTSLTSYKCPGAPKQLENAPTLPSLVQSFQTQVEINVLDKNYTAVAKEYLDYEGNRGLLVLFQNGQETRTIFNYNADEIYTVIDNVCTVKKLNASSISTLFGYDTSDGTFQINTAADALRFGSKYGQYYVGKSTIRGKPVNRWQTCFNWGTANSNFTVDYYFSDPSWKSSSGLDTVPVRIEVQGQQYYSNGSAPRSFHHIYELFNFIATADGQDPALFQTPLNVVCPGRVNAKALPKWPSHFSMRESAISLNLVEQRDIWYNYDKKVSRLDLRINQGLPPFYPVGPVTIIDDFNTGLRYFRDRVQGNCSITHLQNGTFDSIPGNSIMQKNGSYIQKMKLSSQVFDLDSNFTYVGSKTLDDGVPCDMWITTRSDLDLTGIGIPSNTTIEVFYVDKNFHYSPEQGVSWEVDEKFQVPYRIMISAEDIGEFVTYDYSNFNPNEPPLSVFDISDCYTDEQKLRIKIQFTGEYHPDSEARLVYNAQVTIAETMGLSPLRFQNIGLEYDSSYVYIRGSIQDRPPSYAQFTLLPGQEMEKQDDQAWSNITDTAACSDLCINTPDFTCNSFDFCPSDSNSCRLSERRVEEGDPILIMKSICNHYSRTVNTSIDTKTIDEAFGDLQVQIYTQGLEVTVSKADGSVEDFIAVNVEIEYGFEENIPLPSFPDSFSYSSELIIPSQSIIYTTDIYYDNSYQMVRFDYRQPNPIPPYYSTFSQTVIHDYNTGISYNIDQVLLNCTVGGINPRSVIAFDSEINKKVQDFDGAYIVKMKTPLELFGLNKDFKYAGQRTVRGILCNVFEATVDTFIPPGSNATTRARFQFFFQSDRWSTVSNPSTDITRDQPVMLNVITSENDLYLTYNFFNFNDEHVPLSKFDIKPCYNDNQRHRFMMIFNQPFHPYLELGQYLFKREAVLTLASNTGISPIRFSELEIDYGLNTVFLTATLLGNPYSSFYFIMVRGTIPVEKADVEIKNIQVSSDCAAQCVNSMTILCNGFDVCIQSGRCLLYSDHATTVPASNTENCQHYSRLVNSTGPVIPMEHAFTVLKDLVYKKLIKITVPQVAGDPFVYVASNIRDDINQAVSPVDTEGAFLQQFTVVGNNNVLTKYDTTFTNSAVDDCATYCATEDRFDCQSFEYCYTTGDCSLSRIHPDQRPDLLTKNSLCDMYTRQYLKEYQQYKGEVLSTQADKLLSKITNSEDCAAACSKEHSFNCESFDFCGADQPTCRLRKTHILDAGKTVTTSSTCDHYSRNYIFDFHDTGGRLVKGNNDIIINAASSSDCAKICVDQTGIMCNTFEYCGNVSQCRLSTGVSIGYRTEADVCNVYTRVTAAKPNNNNKTDTNTNEKGNKLCKSNTSATDNTGAMIGIAFGMLLPGIVLGALGLFIFQKRRRNSDPMNIQFIRHND